MSPLALIRQLIAFAFFTTGLCAFEDTASTDVPGNFTITVLSIPDIKRGAGLAVVLQTPTGKTWLYDTGSGYPQRLSSDGWSSNFNTGRDLIAPFLKKHNITEIDGVFISHAHYDHFGGLIWLKDHYSIKKLIDSGYTFSSENPEDYKGTNREEIEHYHRIREEFRDKGIYQKASAGDVIDMDPQLKVLTIAPPRSYFGDPKVHRISKNDSPSHYLVNTNSFSIRIQHKDVVFYFPGDIQTEDLNTNLLPSVDHSLLKCDVLIAPGHGIHCTPEFAKVTSPKVSIASVFERYARGLKSTPMLKAVGAHTYITGLDGNIRTTSDGRVITTTTEPAQFSSSSSAGPDAATQSR